MHYFENTLILTLKMSLIYVIQVVTHTYIWYFLSVDNYELREMRVKRFDQVLENFGSW